MPLIKIPICGDARQYPVLKNRNLIHVARDIIMKVGLEKNEKKPAKSGNDNWVARVCPIQLFGQVGVARANLSELS